MISGQTRAQGIAPFLFEDSNGCEQTEIHGAIGGIENAPPFDKLRDQGILMLLRCVLLDQDSSHSLRMTGVKAPVFYEPEKLTLSNPFAV